uniref:Uncharacterized protein n=1 Tax=Anguilla anguilla TaxID=7936 RepID=A0A0E9WG05_ANGAN
MYSFLEFYQSDCKAMVMCSENVFFLQSHTLVKWKLHFLSMHFDCFST